MKNKLRSLLRRQILALLRPVFRYELSRKDQLIGALLDYHTSLQADMEETDQDFSCAAIVFSRNRAIQLHALLSSYFNHVTHPVPLHILFTCTPEHERSYQDLQELFREHPVTFHRETDFKPQLEELMERLSVQKLFFMTDDALFIQRIDLRDFLRFNPLKALPTLTKGLDNTFCFTKNCPQILPPLVEEYPGMHSWYWYQATDAPEWSYPLSLDGTLFHRAEILHYIRRTSYKAPNSLEGNLQLFLPVFDHRKGICFSRTPYVNVPCNLTQSECKNRSTGAFTVEELLQKWCEGYRIFWEEWLGATHRETQNAVYKFVKR
mgnify:CR=1 FL=1